MDKQELIEAVNDLNDLLFEEEKDYIDVNQDPEIVKEKIKKFALWLFVSDNIKEVTVKVLKELDWAPEDFEDLKPDQKPIPVFQRYGIGPYEKEAEPEVEEVVPEPEEEPQEYTEGPPPTKKPKKKREGPSPYGTALALMGPDPEMPIHELYEAMKDLGFDLKTASGSIKTAHSISRKNWKYYKDNGHVTNLAYLSKEELKVLIKKAQDTLKKKK